MGSNVPLIRRAVLVTLVRVINAIFFLTTSSYCLLTYSSFAYQQFIKPHLVSWLTGFVVWHHLAFWLMLILTAWTLVPELRHGRWRAVAWSYLAVSAVIGMVLLVRPVLPQVENNGRGLALALVALLPPIWLAIFDHRSPQALRPSSESRLLKSALIASVLVWACQVAVIPWRWNQTGDITLRSGDFVFGIATSLVGHALVFALIAGAVIAVVRLGRMAGSGAAEYRLLVIASAIAVTVVTNRIVFASIAFAGTAAWTLSILFGVLVASVWSGVVHILPSEYPAGTASLTTDIVPTIYGALGYAPAPSNDLMGTSLLTVLGEASMIRRRETYVIAASYGAVYAVASHNARRLYVADAVRGGDRAFERDREGRWTNVQVTPGLRAVNQFAIRRYIDELSRLYKLPEFGN